MCTKKAECQIKYGGQNNRNAQCLRGIASMFSTILHFTVNVQRHRPMQIQEVVRPACREAEIKGVVFSVHEGVHIQTTLTFFIQGSETFLRTNL